MRHLFLLLLLSLSFVGLYGQSNNLRAGYIVLTSNDTLSGFIKAQSALSRSEYVLFKTVETDKWQKYLPNQLSAYYYEDSNYYASESVPFKGYDAELSYKQLFLKKLVAGSAELYRLDYTLKERISPIYEYESTFYFFKNLPDGTLFDLLPVDYGLKLNNALGSPDCSFNTRGFNDDGLSSLVLKYSECSNLRLQKVYTKKKFKKLRWGLSAGIASAEVTIRNSENNGFSSGNELGFDFNAFIQSQITSYLDFRIGAKYKSRSHNGTSNVTVSEFYINEGEVLELQSSLRINQIAAPAHLILKKSFGKFTPYVLAGGELGFGLNNTYRFDETRFRREGGNDLLFIQDGTSGINQQDLNSVEIGWVIGIGSSFSLNNGNSAFIEIQYARNNSNNFIENPIHISQRGFSLLVGYNFE